MTRFIAPVFVITVALVQTAMAGDIKVFVPAMNGPKPFVNGKISYTANDFHPVQKYQPNKTYPQVQKFQVGPHVHPHVQIAPPVNCQIPTPTLGFYGNLIPGYGLQVVSVQPHSHAAHVGLESGDVIRSVNGVQIYSQSQYQQLLSQAVQYNHGHVDMVVYNSRPYPAPKVATIHVDLVDNNWNQPHLYYKNQVSMHTSTQW
jgi:S1-C subfamily serine protease